MWEFEKLKKIRGIAHGFALKGEKFSQQIVRGEQVHRDKIIWVDEKVLVKAKKGSSAVGENAIMIPKVDALVTRESGIILGVFVADCVPILFVEPQQRIVGVIHAGWRGTALEITRKTMEFLKIRPFNILVGIGPALCAKHFVVGEEVARQFPKEVVQESVEEDGRFHVDLVQANILQLLEVGVLQKNIEVMPHCTYEETGNLYSYRRGDRTVRNVAWISLT